MTTCIDLEGKVAIVTGAASKRGIGHAVVLRLARDGADIVAAGHRASPPSLFAGDEAWRGLPEVVEEVEALGRKALAVTADVSDSSQVSQLFSQALARFPRIDILVNCAGVHFKVGTPVADYDEEDWNKTLAVNLTGPFLLCKLAARHMIEHKIQGKIVNISSVQGKKGVAGSAAYSASKFGLIGLTESLALELAPHKINVNAVCPGAIMTNARDSWLEEKAGERAASIEDIRERYIRKTTTFIPLGRMGTVEDIANAVSFLASSQSDFMTGQAIGVSGRP